MDQEKTLQKLINKAKEVEEVEIPSNYLSECTLEEFLALNSEVFYNNGIFYRKKEKEGYLWLYFDTNGKLNKPLIIQEKIQAVDPNIIARIENLEKWIVSFKEYTVKKIAEIENNQEEALREIKFYIDNKK